MINNEMYSMEAFETLRSMLYKYYCKHKDGKFKTLSLEDQIQKNNMTNIAFGAHFIKNLRTSKIKTWLYDEESFSKNVILTENKVQITPSSFNLQPIQTIQF